MKKWGVGKFGVWWGFVSFACPVGSNHPCRVSFVVEFIG